MFDKIYEYLQHLTDSGWYVQRIYKGDFIPTFLLTRTVVEMDPCVMTQCQYEITLYTKDTKKGHLFVLDDEFYSTDDEVIEELKNMGIK
jgi:hypothetical protein